MRVTDDGIGIMRDDVSKAFLRHATSKILDKNDLEKISTLGFRGEALASIIAVSKVELITKSDNSLDGTHFTSDSSGKEFIEDIGCPKGTTIIVRDLFYNVPVRMKFLKKDVSEANSIAALIDKMALSHPEISFKFIRNGKEEIDTPGNGDIKSAIFAVYGKEFCNSLIPIDYNSSGICVSGFISLPNNSKANRRMQNFFINGRYVKSQTAMVALEQAYKGSIMVGKFPACVMYINIPCEVTDVNIHPAKLEIRFIDERPVFEAVYHGVKSSIVKNERLSDFNFKNDITTISPSKSAFVPDKTQKLNQPKVTLEKNKSKTFSNNKEDKPLYTESKTFDGFDNILQENDKSLLDNTVVKDCTKNSDAIRNKEVSRNVLPQPKKNLKSFEDIDDIKIEIPKKHIPRLPKENSLLQPEHNKTLIKSVNDNDKFCFVGEAFSSYIIVEKENEILLIDKHAAHERLIYEKLKSQNSDISAQVLLSPITLQINKDEYAIAIRNIDILNDAGFEIEDFGSGTILIRTAPMYLEKSDIVDTIEEILEYISQNKKDITTEYLDWIYHNVACRAAIKAGELQSTEELVNLVKNLEANPDIKHCPHGRPVYISIKKKEIEKQFGRMG